jgi:hypothetical protein
MPRERQEVSKFGLPKDVASHFQQPVRESEFTIFMLLPQG